MRTIVVLALLLAAAPARADDRAEAERLADEGDQLVDAGRVSEACAKFEASVKLAPDELEVRRSLATCREELGQLATAWTHWRELKKRARAAGLTQLAVVATDHLTAIEPKLAHLTIRATDAPDGLVVSLDGVELPASSLDAAAAIDQGEHEISAQAPGYQRWIEELFIENGAYKTVEVGPLTPLGEEAPVDPDGSGDKVSPSPHEPTTTEPPSPARKYAGVAATAIGGVVLAIGAWAAFDAKSQRDDARALGCTNDLSSCPSGPAFDAADGAYARANLATGLLLSGAVVAAVGAVVWLTAPSAPRRRAATSWRLDLGTDRAGVAYAKTF